jgi:lysophospholipase L1-like esterase
MKKLIGIFLSLVMIQIISVNAQNSHEKDSLLISVPISRLNDWPNLSRFKEENLKLGLPAVNEKRVVFMGNSITQGWAKYWDVYFGGKPYINRGIGGQTSPQMLVRFRADVILLKPAVVVLLCGANDIAGNTGPSTPEMIENNIASMSELAIANNIKVVLCSILPAYDFPWKPGQSPAERITLLNAWIKNYADIMGFTYVDYYTPLADERKGLKAEYSQDGVHPNNAGYDIMTPLVEKAISQALKSKK